MSLALGGEPNEARRGDMSWGWGCKAPCAATRNLDLHSFLWFSDHHHEAPVQGLPDASSLSREEVSTVLRLHYLGEHVEDLDAAAFQEATEEELQALDMARGGTGHKLECCDISGGRWGSRRPCCWSRRRHWRGLLGYDYHSCKGLQLVHQPPD